MTEKNYAVTVPKWGIATQRGTVVAWRIETGGEVSKGDELIDIETDKIVNMLEAPGSAPESDQPRAAGLPQRAAAPPSS